MSETTSAGRDRLAGAVSAFTWPEPGALAPPGLAPPQAAASVSTSAGRPARFLLALAGAYVVVAQVCWDGSARSPWLNTYCGSPKNVLEGLA